MSGRPRYVFSAKFPNASISDLGVKLVDLTEQTFTVSFEHDFESDSIYEKERYEEICSFLGTFFNFVNGKIELSEVLGEAKIDCYNRIHDRCPFCKTTPLPTYKYGIVERWNFVNSKLIGISFGDLDHAYSSSAICTIELKWEFEECKYWDHKQIDYCI